MYKEMLVKNKWGIESLFTLLNIYSDGKSTYYCNFCSVFEMDSHSIVISIGSLLGIVSEL